VDHGELHRLLCVHRGATLGRRRNGEHGALGEGAPAGRDDHTVDKDPSTGDEPARDRPRHVGQHGDGPVHPDAGQERRDLDDERALDGANALGFVGRRTDAANTTTPIVMQASATLKVGQ
jgi:hypothetical protein